MVGSGNHPLPHSFLQLFRSVNSSEDPGEAPLLYPPRTLHYPSSSKMSTVTRQINNAIYSSAILELPEWQRIEVHNIGLDHTHQSRIVLESHR